jgi:hypothetical protein
MNVKARLDRLEQHLKPRIVYGFFLQDTQRVAIVGTPDRGAVRLPLDEFERRYPSGVIVKELATEAMLDAL